MRPNAALSTCKSSKQTQHVSASSWGCCGLLVDDDPAEEDDDVEVELEAVDVVSCALAVVSVGFKALLSKSISVATAPGSCEVDKYIYLLLDRLFDCRVAALLIVGGNCRVLNN